MSRNWTESRRRDAVKDVSLYIQIRPHTDAEWADVKLAVFVHGQLPRTPAIGGASLEWTLRERMKLAAIVAVLRDDNARRQELVAVYFSIGQADRSPVPRKSHYLVVDAIVNRYGRLL